MFDNKNESIGLFYFPSIEWFLKNRLQKNILVDSNQKHSKNSHWNRMMIAGGEGKIRLSIPLQSGRETKQVYKDIKISQEYKWQEQHLKTIVSCYKRSPWFEYYQDSLETLYQTKFMFLWDWNLECLNWVLQKMNMIKDFDIIDLGFSDLENNPFIFRKAIDLPEVKYNQVFQERIGFQSGVSILDLLFCEGKEAVGILRLNKTSGS